MENFEFKLIDNTYAVGDAREILYALVLDKIKFLNHKILSLQERFGADTSRLEQRVGELQSKKRELLDFLEAFQDQSVEVDIDCVVNIQLKQLEGGSSRKEMAMSEG